MKRLLLKHSVIGLAGSRSSAKTSLALTELLQLKAQHQRLKIAVFGVNEELYPYLQQQGITILHSKMDILDLRMRDTIIFVDEMALFFDTASKNKELGKLQRFLDRIEHQNCKIIMGTAREGYFNKFMCSRISAFLVKQIEYDSLVNGTWLKERVKAIQSASDYRLEIPKNTYYEVCADSITTKHTFEYMEDIDTKRHHVDLFDEILSEKTTTKTTSKITKFDEQQAQTEFLNRKTKKPFIQEVKR